MRKILRSVMKLFPFLRKIALLQNEEEELQPKVMAGVEKVMANGDTSKKEKITDKVRTELRKCGEPV